MKKNMHTTITVSNTLLEELFGLTGKKAPEVIGDKEISVLVNDLKSKKHINSNDSQKNVSCNSKQKSILIIDDIGVVIYQLELLLSRYNYRICLARTKEEALEVFYTKGPFNIILQDLCLPDKEIGLELLKELSTNITNNKQSCQIIIMSVLNDPQVIHTTLDLGANYFINKDINWKSELENKLNNL